MSIPFTFGFLQPAKIPPKGKIFLIKAINANPCYQETLMSNRKESFVILGRSQASLMGQREALGLTAEIIVMSVTRESSLKPTSIPGLLH